MGFENPNLLEFLCRMGIFWLSYSWVACRFVDFDAWPPGFEPRQLQQAGFHLKEMMMDGHCFPEVLVDGGFPVEQVAPTVYYFFSPLGATSDVSSKNKDRTWGGLMSQVLGIKKIMTKLKLEKNTLPETNSSPLKMDGWNTILSFPIGFRPIFRGEVLLVSGRVLRS